MQTYKDGTLKITGEELKNKRQQYGLSQSQLAKEAGCSDTYISHIESGRRKRIGYKIAESFSNLLHIPLTELIEEQGLAFDVAPYVRLGTRKIKFGSTVELNGMRFKCIADHYLVGQEIIDRVPLYQGNQALEDISNILKGWLDDSLKEILVEQVYELVEERGKYPGESYIGLMSRDEYLALSRYIDFPQESFWLRTKAPTSKHFLIARGMDREVSDGKGAHGIVPVVYVRSQTKWKGNGTGKTPFYVTTNLNEEKTQTRTRINVELLKELREKANWSQQMVAEMIGYTTTWINQVENGKNDNPSFDLMVKLAKLYNIPLESLVANDKE